MFYCSTGLVYQLFQPALIKLVQENTYNIYPTVFGAKPKPFAVETVGSTRTQLNCQAVRKIHESGHMHFIHDSTSSADFLIVDK